MKPARAGSLRRPLDVEAGRQALMEGRESLRQRYRRSGNGAALLRDHCRLVDGILRQAWQDLSMPASIALLAVGGYGRRQLYPCSDIDLLVLLPTRQRADADDALRSRLEHWVRILWDMGLDIGHGVRTLAECREDAGGDITVQTSLLEARQLAGARSLYAEFTSLMQGMLEPRAFFIAKQLEQQQRHGRYHDATQNLEPNLKEAPGGLRDLQNILWIARAARLGASWQELARGGFVTQREARLARRHQSILQDLRIRLHYLAGRREDRLLFDYQATLATELDIADALPRRASELLMQRYYRAARMVTQINTLLLPALRTRIFPITDIPPVILDARFQQRGELLEIRDEGVFRRDPGAMLESVLLLQRHPRLRARSPAMLRAMWRAAPLIDASFRRDPRHRALFMDILRQPRGLTRELRLLNRYGILGRYIPAFGRIVGQMQHDLFHVYTVDEHILMVIRNLRRFMEPEFAHEFPLCSQLIGEFERPEVLFLAGLFHDIAKGRNGDHSRLGSVDAGRFCSRHGLSAADTGLVAWLVEHHLAMSITAQKKDISDPGVIADFARHVDSKRRLVALYLLTVADIRGTSPKVWNSWKGKLLEDLLWATHRHLSGAPDHESDMSGHKGRVHELLGRCGIPADTRERIWSTFDRTYWLLHDAEEIVWHMAHLKPHLIRAEPGAIVVRARIVPRDTGIGVLVYAPDQKDLFARICSFFDSQDYNIVQARIHTTRDGHALDSFLVLDPFDAMERQPDATHVLACELALRLVRQSPLKPPPQARLSRHLKHFPIMPEVDIEPDENGSYHILSIVAGDQPGLLTRIALVLADCGIDVHGARINTLGERAEDVFLITGDALHDTPALLRLETALLAVLQTPQGATHTSLPVSR
ncbi:[protein-PII] uridylyltransferase [Nitrosovibrio sp. Nv17]|uniref:[protein-PII] uridylyltransferase n=1 Tax=Nitrosovibrio sp. Nv17 TaxID=1855339 RepID=UPI000908DC43|nr:UTP--GlnB (protein PII) uridylyltransferase, GlnD [Nitrosovibrio sp. Nv17]